MGLDSQFCFLHSDTKFLTRLSPILPQNPIWISSHWPTIKMQFWEVFTAISFWEENNLISSKIVKGLGQEFWEEREAVWMDEKTQHFPRDREFSPEFLEAKAAAIPLLFKKWTWNRWMKSQKYCIDDSPVAAESETTILSRINGEALRSNFPL